MLILSLWVDEIAIDLLETINLMQPFGLGNFEPRFLTKRMSIVGINYIGNNKQHISFRLLKDNKFLKAIYFNGVEDPLINDTKVGDTIDLVYRLKENNYRGVQSIDLFIDAIRFSD